MTTDPSIEKFLASLDRSQYLSPQRQIAYQRKLLEPLLVHAREQTVHYRQRLDPIFNANGTIDWSRWSDLPILTRADAQNHYSDLRAKSFPRQAGDAIEETSSGSTGRPLRHATTEMQHLASACCSERFFNWHKIAPDGLVARIRAATHPDAQYPKGLTTQGWRPGHPQSQVIDLAIAADIEEQLSWLARVKPRYLATYPSNLRELAKRSRGRLSFDAIMTFGEMVSEDMQNIFSEHFGMRAFDRYGASEVGHIAGSCPMSHSLHIASELVLVEIVDEHGRCVPPGVTGRIVVTPFYNFAMPFIRYDLGDFGSLSPEPCACGRSLPMFKKLMGRNRNMFRFADGTTRWPVLFSSELNRFVPNSQFQIVQHTYSEMEFRFVPRSITQDNDHFGLEAYFKDRLHPAVTVRLTQLEQIPRSSGGKYEDYLCLIPEDQLGAQILPSQ